MLDQITATRYVTPLKEGGSLPGIVEADDYGTYVLKFRGAGQGPKVLVAEVIVGELARALDLSVPRLAVVDLQAPIAKYEADEEVQDLLTASLGLNLGIDFLPGSFGYDGSRPPAPDTAADILWLDALTANVDRTWSNPNLLVWHRNPWLIDHGAALYFHHGWPSRGADPHRFATQAFDASTHVLRDVASSLPAAHERLSGTVTAELLAPVVAAVPDSWLEAAPGLDTPAAVRAAYVEHLLARVAEPVRLATRGRVMTRHGYQYVVLRCVPRVEREEFLNVGLVLYSQGADFLEAAYRVDAARLRAFAPQVDVHDVDGALETIAQVCRGVTGGGLPTLGGLGRRFGWLSAPRSTVVQPGPVHGGLTADPATELRDLLQRLVD